MLSARGLTKRFGGVVVAQDLDIDIAAGEVVALIGPNGAGKTTLFNMLTGVTRPDRGTISFAGHSIEGLAAHKRARLGLARTWQRPRLFESLTLLDNLIVAGSDYPGEHLSSLLLRPAQILQAETRAAAQALLLLERVGLANRANAMVTALSYGQQKLVGLARALMNDGRCLLLDEPMAGVEGRTVDAMKSVIRGEARAGKAICIVEHNIGFIRDICDRAIFMFNGRIVSVGAIEELLADKRLTELYFGAH